MWKKRSVALLLLLAACSEYNGPKAGVVVGHEYDDDDSYMSPGINIPGSCSTSNGVTSCSPGIYVPGHWVDEPERWLLVLEDGEDRGKFSVPIGVWETVADGQWYDTETGEVTSR